MRARGTRPEPGQKWEACSWQAARTSRRTVEVKAVDPPYVVVVALTGTGSPLRRILAESLLAKYRLLPAEENGSSDSLREDRMAAGEGPGPAQAQEGSALAEAGSRTS